MVSYCGWWTLENESFNFAIDLYIIDVAIVIESHFLI